jgi:two-component system NtrC family response regulator
MLEKMAEENNRNISGFTTEATLAIESYHWPGNIREMENKIKRAIIMCDEKFVSSKDLGIDDPESFSINLREVRQNAEKTAIKQAISMTDGNYSSAAKLLGITRPTLYDLIKKYNL